MISIDNVTNFFESQFWDKKTIFTSVRFSDNVNVKQRKAFKDKTLTLSCKAFLCFYFVDFTNLTADLLRYSVLLLL